MGPINIVMGNQNQLIVKKVQNSIIKHFFDVLKNLSCNFQMCLLWVLCKLAHKIYSKNNVKSNVCQEDKTSYHMLIK
jgi:hypothetical protein